MRSPRDKYTEQKHGAFRRGITWNITFEEWWNFWQQSGKWDLRGRKKGQYCMCRFGDIGPYEIGNIYIDLATTNAGLSHLGKPSPKKGVKMTAQGKSKLNLSGLDKGREPAARKKAQATQKKNNKISPLKGTKRPKCSHPSVFKGIKKRELPEDIKDKIRYTIWLKQDGEIICRIHDRREMKTVQFKKWINKQIRMGQ
jgi:hypothetical protein